MLLETGETSIDTFYMGTNIIHPSQSKFSLFCTIADFRLIN